MSDSDKIPVTTAQSNVRSTEAEQDWVVRAREGLTADRQVRDIIRRRRQQQTRSPSSESDTVTRTIEVLTDHALALRARGELGTPTRGSAATAGSDPPSSPPATNVDSGRLSAPLPGESVEDRAFLDIKRRWQQQRRATSTAAEAAVELAKAGKADVAVEVANEITDTAIRNETLSRIAKGE